ncbi:hypothetical protein PHYSODRAFT_286297 [Phytophthora sojae]|uniref:RxLR effector protein n=2 Tax=Phytophthora sojae TaxID=67593 RepID=G4ZMI8_PHYSP|nr:hypothetical protein PHYSODRAFT_286297 [Phytophthora sojae]AEK80842.1 Avh178 [Phytophthora sojae]AEK80843.1 Avh178 [Phytophthora sojae]AEK80844.1 Avh178 [Phytophthora sojae]EGZ15335.1 hypothetical protein PHYSODRAFT_286297 [Phytophthora sojae]|eukprot:XP_009529084.1 hypothetical protein PHYSODRAFT_286297 [Phytophthora sojae]
MPTNHLLLLLLTAFVVNTNAAVATKDLPNTRNHRILTSKVTPENEELPSIKGEKEEKVFMPSAVARLKGLFGKIPGLGTKFSGAGKDSAVFTAVERMPIVNKLDNVVERNPNFVEKLSKDPRAIERLENNPEIARVSTMLEQNKFKVTQKDINQLRNVVGDDATRLSKLEIIEVARQVGRWLVLDTIAYILFVALILGLVAVVANGN